MSRLIAFFSMIFIGVITSSYAQFYIQVQPYSYPQRAPDTTYFCLDPDGTEFGGTVGPIRMWFSTYDNENVSSPYTKDDACEHVRRMCNKKFPARCQGDCLAGRAASWEEGNCEGSFLLAPSRSVPTHIMQVNP